MASLAFPRDPNSNRVVEEIAMDDPNYHGVVGGIVALTQAPPIQVSSDGAAHARAPGHPRDSTFAAQPFPLDTKNHSPSIASSLSSPMIPLSSPMIPKVIPLVSSDGAANAHVPPPRANYSSSIKR
jgi:hypothetical protein